MHTSRAAAELQNPAAFDSLWASIRGSQSDADEPGPFRRPSPAKRGEFLLGRLLSRGQSGVRVRHLGGNRAGELRITRFLRSRHVTPREMFATARARTPGTWSRIQAILVPEK